MINEWLVFIYMLFGARLNLNQGSAEGPGDTTGKHCTLSRLLQAMASFQTSSNFAPLLALVKQTAYEAMWPSLTFPD